MFNATVAGNIGRDAEVRQTQSGQTVCTFSVGVNKGSQENRETCWVTCNIWGKRGESLAQYLKKGTKVSCSGSLWAKLNQGQDGQQYLNVDMQVNDIELMGQSQQQQQPQQQMYAAPQPQYAPAPQPQQNATRFSQPYQPATMQQMHQMAYGQPQIPQQVQQQMQQQQQGELFSEDIPF